MGYILKREEGRLRVEFKLKRHHHPECNAEGRDHDLPTENLLVIWYETDSGWQILATGDNALRILNSTAKEIFNGKE